MVFGMEGKSGGVLVRCWIRLVYPLAWLTDSPALPIHPLPLLEEVLDHPIHLGHQNVSLSFEMTPPSDICWVVIGRIINCGRAVHSGWAVTCGRAVPCCRPLWLGRCLWPSRPLLPGRCLWPSRNLWSGLCLWPCRCVLPGRHSWPSRRLLPGRHVPSRPLPVPGLELLGPIQHESAGPARQPP